MKAEKIDWPLLQGAIVAFVSGLVISGALIGGSWYYEDKMQVKYNKDKQLFQSVSSQYLQVDQEEGLINQYYPEFINLYNEGLLGQERRLNWIEVLRASSERIRLPALRYEIASQNQFTPDYPLNKGAFQIYNSTMKLNIDLLHEGDLPRLFEDLNAQAQGRYNVSKCSFRRLGDLKLNDSAQGNISVECELQWFNIKKSDGREINPL